MYADVNRFRDRDSNGIVIVVMMMMMMMMMMVMMMMIVMMMMMMMMMMMTIVRVMCLKMTRMSSTTIQPVAARNLEVSKKVRKSKKGKEI